MVLIVSIIINIRIVPPVRCLGELSGPIMRRSSFDFIATMVAEAVFGTNLTAAAFASRSELRSTERAVQVFGALGRAAGGANCHAALIDFVDDQANEVGKQSDQSPIQR